MLSHTSSESLAFHIGFPVVRMDWQTNGHVIIKISRMDRLPNFIGMHGALLACAICTHRALLLVESWKMLSKIWRIMQIWMNEWMNEWQSLSKYALKTAGKTRHFKGASSFKPLRKRKHPWNVKFFQPFQCIQCILMNFAIHNYNILQ